MNRSLIVSSTMRRVSLGEIDPEVPYRLSWGRDLRPLEESLAMVGQTQPLILWPDADRLLLLCGFRRRQALERLGIDHCQALVLPSATPCEALLLAIEDNLAVRTPNEAERTLMVEYLTRFIPDDELISGYLPRLGLPPRREYLERYRSLAGIGREGLDALAGGALDPESACLLLDHAPEARAGLFALLTELNPNHNQRRQLLTFVEEICRRENLAADQLLGSADLMAIRQQDRLSRPQRAQMVREWLRRRRYPVLTGLERARADHLAALGLPSGIRLNLPPHFEGLGFSVTLDFTDSNGLRAGLEAMIRVTDSPHLSALLETG